MSKTFKMVTVVGTSESSYEDAIKSGIADASRTLRHISWFEVKEMRGAIAHGAVREFQVKMEIGLKVD